MAPKRKSGAGKASPATKKAKTTPAKASGPPDLSGKETYCAEVGIDMAKGGSQALFQWLCCSIIFGNRISEKTTIRAAKGLINAGLTTPESVKDASWEEKIKALNSEGNVQRGPSMSDRLGGTAKLVIEKYDGDLSKLREAAKNKVAAEKKLIKEFKGIGEVGINIFFREAQLQWDELFPFADASSLKLAKEHGYPSKNAKELAAFVDNDKTKFVALLAAMTKDELRGTNLIQEAGRDGGDKAEEPESGEGNANDETADDKKEPEGEAKEDKPETAEKLEKEASKAPEESKDTEMKDAQPEEKTEAKSEETGAKTDEKTESKTEEKEAKTEEKTESKTEEK